MKCTEIDHFVDPFIDDEFDERERAEVEMHLGACPACRQNVEVQGILRQRVREVATEVSAPARLRARVLAELEACQVTHRGGWAMGRWRSLSLASVGVVLLGLGLALMLSRGDREWTMGGDEFNGALGPALVKSRAEKVVEDSVDWHRLRLPMEVSSTQPDDVRTWFDGKVDFPVQVPDFKGEAALVGGRLAHMGAHRAALVTMEVKHRKLSMMAFPVHNLAPNRKRMLRHQPRIMMKTNNGYHVVIIHGGDVAYSFVSDLPKVEMQRLMRDVKFQ